MNSLDYGWLNVGSLIVISILSISACAISLFFQICYNHHLVEIQDWSALMDTTSSLVKVSAVLLIVTIALNIINIVIYGNKVSK